MEEATRIDVRLSPLLQSVKARHDPQTVYFDKVANLRAERADGIVNLYRHADIVKVNRHPAVLGTGGRGGTFGGGLLIPLEIDGEDHRKWRRLLDPMFAPKKIAHLEDSVRALAGELIDSFSSAGTAELHDDFCVPLPCVTFLRLVGAPTSDLDFFLEFKEGVVHPKGDTVEEIDANIAAAGGKLLEYFATFLAARREETEEKPDIISALLHSEVDGEPITNEDLINILFLFMFAGLDTVTASLSCIFARLGQHPEERDMLVADMTKIPDAIEELMRYESPVAAGQRYATADIDLGDGLEIRQGEAIQAFWSSANLDPAAFNDPLKVDFERGRANHIVFASGIHRCLGSHLARLELRIAVEELLTRTPDFAVTATDDLTYDNVGVRTVTHLPVSFTPRPSAS